MTGSTTRVYDLDYFSSITGGTMTLLLDSSGWLEAKKTTLDDIKTYVISGLTTSDIYASGATFNTASGIITTTMSDLSTYNVDIDGRYLEASNSNIGVNNLLYKNNVGSITGTTNVTYKEDVLTTTNDISINNLSIGKGNNSVEGNSVIGENAFGNNVSGPYNVVVGSGALHNSETGGFNTVVGQAAGFSLIDGTYNVMIGTSAGGNITGGTHNVLIGASAGYLSNIGKYNVYIGERSGYPSTTHSDYVLNIGVTGNTLIYGQFNNNRLFTRTPSTAPTDADLLNSSISFYLDESTHNLKCRVRYSNGTLKTATIAFD